MPCRSRASTSSPGTTRRPSPATSRSGRSAWSRCGSRASGTTSSTSSRCPGFPVSLIGLVALPWTGRAFALRPLVVLSVGDLPRHEPGLPGRHDVGHVPPRGGRRPRLLIVSALLALDALIARVGEIRGWTRPVAWLGPTLTIASGLLFSIGLVGYANQATDVARRYRAPRRPDGRDRPAARRHRRSGRHRLPDLAGRGASDPDPGPARRVPGRCRRPRAGVPGHALSS